MIHHSRRSFLESASGAATLGTFLNLNPKAMGANETIRVALIGARNQGRGVALRHIEAGAKITTLCDIDDAVNAKVGPMIAQAQGSAPQYVKDYRRVLDDKNIDAVIISTPDHWHTHMALAACQAGKDIFLEKPVSQTIREGQLIRDAVRKYNRVLQVGTMRRSAEHFRAAAEYVGSGKLGKICLIKAWMCQVRKSIGNPPDSAPPEGVDYDLWLGPAPKRPFNPNRFHYNWRFFWDYGNTELGNQGVHLLDIALWGIQMMRKGKNCLPVRVSGQSGIYWLKDAKEVPDTQVLAYDYGDFILSWELRSFAAHNPVEGTAAGTGFYGTEASLIVDHQGWKVYASDGSIAASMKSTPYRHEQNFLECIKSRRQPVADIETGRLSTTLCHLGNVVTRLNRTVVFDPATETFGADKQANALLSKTYRAAYPLPRV